MQIPELCKPDQTIMLGYSGGMALYINNWASLLKLYKVILNSRRTSDVTFYYLLKNNPITLN